MLTEEKEVAACTTPIAPMGLAMQAIVRRVISFGVISLIRVL